MPLTKNTMKHMNTIQTLMKDFEKIGLCEGMTVIVHTSMSKLGWVCGGANAVVDALMQVIGPEGTIVMPAHSSELSEPSYWENPPVSPDWWETIREEMPPFDPKITPTKFMGAVAEAFRSYEGVIRSYHPASSFTAWGKNAEYITKEHSLEYSFGEHSPLQKLYDLDAYILLLGVDYDNNTSLHLAECYAESCFTCEHGAPILVEGQRVWKTYVDFIYNIEHFNEIGKEFEELGTVRKSYVGIAESRLIPQRQLVDFAAGWLTERKREGAL